MFGKLLSTAVKVATVPLDAVNIAADVATGGSGRKRSRSETPLLGDAEAARDRLAETLEGIDE